MALMLDPALGVLLVGCYALLFASAALQKLRDPQRFATLFAAYRILPEGTGRIAAVVPMIELAVAAALLPAASRTAAAVAGITLLLVYAGAIALNLARGRRELACGCGGPDAARPIAPWMVERNLALAALLALLLAPLRVRALEPTDALTVGAGLAISALLYMSLDRLLGRVAPRGNALRGSR